MKTYNDAHMVVGAEVAYRSFLMTKTIFGVIKEVHKDKLTVQFGNDIKLCDKKECTVMWNRPSK